MLFVQLTACENHKTGRKKQSQKRKNSESTNKPGRLIDISTETSYVFLWTWQDYQGRVFSDTIRVMRYEVLLASKSRLKLKPLSPVFRFPDYSTIVNSNTDFVKSLAQSLQKIANKNQLNRREFMDMVFCMVQNIPYTLLHNKSHEGIEDFEEKRGGSFFRNYHQNPENRPINRPYFGGCQENVEPCGVYSPAEFAASFKGDCDTRTVFLFTLLKHLKFDVAVANCSSHSMVVTSVRPDNPAAHFIVYRGVKYFFWESTVFFHSSALGRGPRIGDTPRGFSPAEWNIVLI